MAGKKKEFHNNVAAKGQLPKDEFVTAEYAENAVGRILFAGNSITKHGFLPEIGWYGEWGMAASCREKDYVHQVLAALKCRLGDFDCCIAQCAEWERRYTEGEKVLEEYYQKAKEFDAEVVVVRLGENMPYDEKMLPVVKEQYSKLVKFLIGKSTKQVILTDNFWRNDPFDRIYSEVASENGYTFCKISDLCADENTMALGKFEHEGVARHPGDFGMAEIAERIVEKIDLSVFDQQ